MKHLHEIAQIALNYGALRVGISLPDLIKRLMIVHLREIEENLYKDDHDIVLTWWPNDPNDIPTTVFLNMIDTLSSTIDELSSNLFRFDDQADLHRAARICTRLKVFYKRILKRREISEMEEKKRDLSVEMDRQMRQSSLFGLF